MGNDLAPFTEIGKRARDLLTKDYNYDRKFSLAIPSSTGMGFTTTGVKKGQIFVGDISVRYRSGKTIVDVKVDTYFIVSTKVIYDVVPGTKAVISFNVPDHKSDKCNFSLMCITFMIMLPLIPVLAPSPLFKVSAAIGSKDIAIDGEVGFDTRSSSFTKYKAGISFNKQDFSAALLSIDKGQTVKTSYAHVEICK